MTTPEFTFKTRLIHTKHGLICGVVSYDNDCHNRHPSFSITADTFRPEYIRGERPIDFEGAKWYPDGGGCMHDDLAKAFPALAPFMKWHLCDVDGPMHYVADAIFHAQIFHGVSEYPRPEDAPERAREHFKSTVALGAVEGDNLPACFAWGDINVNRIAPTHREAWKAYTKASRERIAENVTAWCEARLPALRAAFARDLETVRSLELTLKGSS